MDDEFVAFIQGYFFALQYDTCSGKIHIVWMKGNVQIFGIDIKGKIGIKEVLEDSDIARISIVGVGMKSHPGVAGKMFEVLAKNRINIEMISTSDISISCIVQKKFAEKAVRVLHSKFGLAK